MIGAGLLPTSTWVPASWVSIRPEAFRWERVSVEGPRPAPFRTMISPGEIGPSRLLAALMAVDTKFPVPIGCKRRTEPLLLSAT